ncbi:hypothetical protein HYS94_03750 [Candidatus Daviesbacteria bacterium]|nr:hypothetical protein [Candidatus Daviesbacteria bacterium]
MQDKKIGTDKEQAIFEELLLNPKFQKIVPKIRISYGIPPDGFKNGEEYLKWWQTYNFEYKEFKVAQELFDLDINDNPELLSKKISKRRIKIYHIDLCKILKELDLSLEWLPFIDGCVTMNKDINSKGKISYYFANLTRETCEGVIISEELHLNFGATMNLKRIFDDPFGGSIWMKEVEPLQSIMQGYKEKKRRPKRSGAALQSKIYHMAKEGLSDSDIEAKLYTDGLINDDFNFWSIRKNKQRARKKYSPNS